MRVCGVDEAGRGSVLGPLVVAGVSATRATLERLRALGVRDSKEISPERRAKLCAVIRGAADVSVSVAGPASVDRMVARRALNELEAERMARVIARLGANVSYVDSCDVDARRFGRRVAELSGRSVRSYHHADSRFAAVAAASIVAKVERDRALARLRRAGSAAGSGYPSDPATMGFVRAYVREHGAAPPSARASWRPVRLMLSSAPRSSRGRGRRGAGRCAAAPRRTARACAPPAARSRRGCP